MSDTPSGLVRIRTGQPQTDRILDGGFPAHSINIVMGHPGTGKTILAEQLLFHNADGDRPVLYLSTLSEPLAKVVTYLQNFSFYDEEKLFSGAVVYEDLGPALLERGVEALLDRVREAIRELGPKIIVIDSFKAVHDLAESPLRMRRLVSELAGVLSAYDVTTFLVGEYDSEQVPQSPEFAVADGILQLMRGGSEKRDERFLRMLKLRGSTYEEGMHSFRIGPDGLKVYPRLVSPTVPRTYGLAHERTTTGLAGLDEMLGGGPWRGSSVLLVGPAGAGKTTFGLSFALDGARHGEPSLILHLQENPTQLGRAITALGTDVEEARAEGVHLQYESPVELRIDALVVELSRTVEEKGIRRVVIDSLGDLARASGSSERFHDYLYALTQQLTTHGVTTIMILEGVAERYLLPSRDERYSSIADVMIALDMEPLGDPPRRTLRVVKARGIGHPLGARTLVIEKGGMRLAQEEESEDAG